MKTYSIQLMFLAATLSMFAPSVLDAHEGSASEIPAEINTILADRCFSCHADGENEGSMSFDSMADLPSRDSRNEVWLKVLKQLQAGLMPPQDEPQLSNEQVAQVEQWITEGAFGLDVSEPDPGKVTLRRLNRTEYQNTIRDLMGVEFDAQAFFPADDTGHGFDNIGDVLSISPLLLEKFVDAAKEIVSKNVPTSARIKRQNRVLGSAFKLDSKEPAGENVDESDGTASGGNRLGPRPGFGRSRQQSTAIDLSYYEPQTARARINVDIDGEYEIQLNFKVAETYVDNQFDLNRCKFVFSLDGEELLAREFVRQGNKPFSRTFTKTLSEGQHELVVVTEPLSDSEQIRQLRIRIEEVVVEGPLDPEHFVAPDNYASFFPREVPQPNKERREYAREILKEFSSRAFRRPVDGPALERLVDLAEFVYSDDNSFEVGIGQAMTAVLASPRFLFREEFSVEDSGRFPLIDEYSLASRLSYFLWSSMPDEELLQLASQNELRRQLDLQVRRMLKNQRSQAFFENFAGQWLGSRGIDSVQISARSVLRREAKPDPEADRNRARFFELFRKGDERTDEENEEFEKVRAVAFAGFRRGPRIDLTDEIRTAMRRETEMLWEYIVRDDRSVLEILSSDYTFLNEELAKFYEIEGVQGSQMQRVSLPPDSPRGSVLTHGSILATTSNPDRTSPVKRGLFVLENLLGAPTGAPPPDVPPLEEPGGRRPGSRQVVQRKSLRETLAIHRESDLCSSCHDKMDPLGLALENFNAMGRYRESEFDIPIDAAGQLLTGESFENISQLKRILATNRKTDFYRCLTEKLLTYALGRAPEYQDTLTIEQIVGAIEEGDGRSSILLQGIINSAAFQRTRSARVDIASDN